MSIVHPDKELINFLYYIQLEGKWEKNLLVEGRWILPNGTYYEGKFANNKPVNEGRWYFKNGNICNGVYK